MINAESGLGGEAIYRLADGMRPNPLVNTTLTPSADETSLTLTTAIRPVTEIARELNITEETTTALTTLFTSLPGNANENTRERVITAINAGEGEQLTIQPEGLSAAGAAALSTSTQVAGVTQSRLASLRAHNTAYAQANPSGVSTGDRAQQNAVWVRPFGNIINQSERNNVPGYDSSTQGLALGWERAVNETVTFGGALSYARTDVDGDGAGNVQVDIDSYQLTLYGDITQPNYYVAWHAGVGQNSLETQRTTTAPWPPRWGL